jgi:translocation and assembly module TamA
LRCSTISRTRTKYASSGAAPLASPIVGLLLGAAVLARGSLAQAADPQPYTVTIASTKNDLLDSALKESSQLESLRESAPVGPFALVERAREDAVRLKTVLESFGYYQAQVSITVTGKSLDDPELPDAIATLTADRKAGVTIAVEPGQLYHLRKISIDGEVSASERAALGLEPGAPANAVEVLDAQARLLNALQEHGYAFATVDAPVAYEDPVEFALDVTFKASRGESVAIGEIAITGLKRIQESFVRKRLLLKSGERYSPSKIEKARRDLLGLGVLQRHHRSHGRPSRRVGSCWSDHRLAGAPAPFARLQYRLLERSRWQRRSQMVRSQRIWARRAAEFVGGRARAWGSRDHGPRL